MNPVRDFSLFRAYYKVIKAEKASTNICKKYYDAIFLGRLSYEKNPLRLIEIISDIVKTNPTVKVAAILNIVSSPTFFFILLDVVAELRIH